MEDGKRVTLNREMSEKCSVEMGIPITPYRRRFLYIREIQQQLRGQGLLVIGYFVYHYRHHWCDTNIIMTIRATVEDKAILKI
jgi:hypothetical protein